MLTDRMMRAASLESALYDEVEADPNATTQAMTVVLIVAVANGIGALLSGEGVRALTSGIVTSLIGWAIWAGLTYLIGTSLFGGTATYGEMLRTIGFAATPGVLNVLRFLPIIGGLTLIVTAIWSLAAGVIAVRQALDFDTGKAIGTVIVGWIVQFVILLFLGGTMLVLFGG